MTKKRYFLTVLFFIGTSFSFADVPVTVEVVEVNKIWDKAPHNAFTDLVRWRAPASREPNDKFYCAFREGRGHVSTDGKIRILESKDSNIWNSAALIALEDFDLRDAHLSVTPDGRLMLLGGAAPRKKDNQSAPTGSFASSASLEMAKYGPSRKLSFSPAAGCGVSLGTKEKRTASPTQPEKEHATSIYS